MNKLSLVAVSLLFISSGALVVGAHDYKDNDLKETKQQLTLKKANGLKNNEIHMIMNSMNFLSNIFPINSTLGFTFLCNGTGR